jgi:hypothetical protein
MLLVWVCSFLIFTRREAFRCDGETWAAEPCSASNHLPGLRRFHLNIDDLLAGGRSCEVSLLPDIELSSRLRELADQLNHAESDRCDEVLMTVRDELQEIISELDRRIVGPN